MSTPEQFQPEFQILESGSEPDPGQLAIGGYSAFKYE
jgi:hypothetical protein